MLVGQILESEFIRIEVFQDTCASGTWEGSAVGLEDFGSDKALKASGRTVKIDISELQNEDIVDAIHLWEIFDLIPGDGKIKDLQVDAPRHGN